jgi:hypothetical protein
MIQEGKEILMNPFLIMDGDLAGKGVGQVWMLSPMRMHRLFSVIRE